LQSNVKFHKKLSAHPLFVAGPLPTDLAVGYDHIAGKRWRKYCKRGRSRLLCYITPSEHLGLPGPEQVRDGLVAFKIAGAYWRTLSNMGLMKKTGLLPEKE